MSFSRKCWRSTIWGMFLKYLAFLLPLELVFILKLSRWQQKEKVLNLKWNKDWSDPANRAAMCELNSPSWLFKLQLLWCDSSKIQRELNIAGFLHYNGDCAMFCLYNYPDTKIPVPISHFSSVPSEHHITTLHAVVLHLTKSIMTPGL